MVLGVYWFFGFPDGLYEFDLFKFQKGLGGHANTDAELEVTFESPAADEIQAEIEALFAICPDAAIFIWRENHKMQIAISYYYLFDYDFLMALEIEKILKRHSVVRDYGVKFEPVTLRGCSRKKGVTTAFAPISSG